MRKQQTDKITDAKVLSLALELAAVMTNLGDEEPRVAIERRITSERYVSLQIFGGSHVDGKYECMVCTSVHREAATLGDLVAAFWKAYFTREAKPN